MPFEVHGGMEDSGNLKGFSLDTKENHMPPLSR